MGTIIAFANHKGGVGKTTSAINIGAGLNQLKKKVLIVDLDPQSNLSQSFGLIDSENNIYGALRQNYKINPFEILKGLHIVPSTIDLSGAEIELSNEVDREYFLKEILDEIKDSYDYILIDCPPSLGLLTLNAFTAADEIIIPLQSEYFASQGLEKLVDVIKRIQKRLNTSLTICGVFLTQYDSRKLLNRDIFEYVKTTFHDQVFETKIRNNVALAEAQANQLDIFRYNPNSNGAEDYKQLSKEIIKRHKK